MNKEFEENGYFVVKDFFDKTTINLLSTYFDIKYKIIKYENNRSNFSTIEGGDFANSYIFYADHLTESVLLKNGQKISNLLGKNLIPTYTFARIYETGQPLLPHTDRPSCEISATCPIFLSDNKPSIIYISNFTRSSEKKNYTIDEIMATNAYTAVELYPGDVMFYKGCERYHWRLPLESDYLIQFFMHAVQIDGIHKDHAFDKRPYLGFNKK